ncbi:hypothetical protein BD626DRAFT_77170 [Schizophyllum amplum]|uniref:Uncharacterized protein n=1 Tax=Schizophyllum amplum TaxID=97359 RepID=A0A550BS67_9AGAR|nr:hypothetical protein BD626DRAFT_77170 [Auriculariopsis ampla]
MALMIRKGFRTRRLIIFLALSATMYIAALLHTCLLMYRVILGVDLTPDVAAHNVWWSDLTHWHIRTLSVLQFMQNVIGDLILAFRTYVAWSYTIWVVVLPSPMFLLGFVTGILSLMPTTPSPFLQLVIRICLPSSLAYSLTMIVLLIWRLSAVHAESSRAGVRDATRPPVLLRIARVVAETGALYVVTYALFIALNFMGRLEMFIVQSALMPIGVA